MKFKKYKVLDINHYDGIYIDLAKGFIASDVSKKYGRKIVFVFENGHNSFVDVKSHMKINIESKKIDFEKLERISKDLRYGSGIKDYEYIDDASVLKQWHVCQERRKHKHIKKGA